MKKKDHKISNSITQYQYLFILGSILIGTGILSLPGEAAASAHNDAWISVLLGGILPIFMALSASFVDKKMKSLDFFDLNKKLYGKLPAYFILVCFFLIFAVYEASALSGFSNIFVYALADYLPPFLVLVIIEIITTFAAIDGLTNLGRLASMTFTVTVIALLIPVYFLFKGSLLNIRPVFDSSGGILMAIPASTYAYSGVEIGFFITAFVVDKGKRKLGKLGVASVAIVIFLYTLVTFSTIFYIGWELASKINYPVLFVLETVSVPVISDFKAIFFFLWSGVIIKAISLDHFIVSYTASKLFKIKYRNACIYSTVLILSIGYFMTPEFKRSTLMGPFMPIATLSTIAWVVITLIFAAVKSRGGKNEKK